MHAHDADAHRFEPLKRAPVRFARGPLARRLAPAATAPAAATPHAALACIVEKRTRRKEGAVACDTAHTQAAAAPARSVVAMTRGGVGGALSARGRGRPCPGAVCGGAPCPGAVAAGARGWWSVASAAHAAAAAQALHTRSSEAPSDGHVTVVNHFDPRRRPSNLQM